MEQARMIIEIELQSAPIWGSLYDSYGIAHEFLGWMELASLLQAAIESANESVLPQ
jgi:hypothetical protein